ncbi:MAG: hypothetical protein ACJ74Q_15295 [Pyrinomonadaceae bacterium]
MPNAPKITDAEAYALYLLDTVHCGWRDGAINIVVPDELAGSFDRLELPEIKRRLAALARKGLVETPTGYEAGKAFFLKPELDAAWQHWFREQRGFEKIEEFKSRG